MKVHAKIKRIIEIIPEYCQTNIAPTKQIKAQITIAPFGNDFFKSSLSPDRYIFF